MFNQFPLKLFSLWLVFLYSASNPLIGESVRVVGSDYAAAALEIRSGSSYSIDGVTIDHKMTGSLMGLIKLKESLADVAFVVQTSEGHPALEGMAVIPLGFWGIYFAVQEENPLSEVAKTDLAEVLRKTKDGLKSEWGTLITDEPKWTNRLIFVTFDILETDASFPVLLHEFFQMDAPDKFSSMGERIENPYLAGPSNLLVMSKLPEPQKGLRALSLVQDGQTVGFPPSAESMFYEDYPLRTKLMLVVRDPESVAVRKYLRNFFTKNSLEKLSQAGLVLVPENVRKQALLEFDLEF